MEVSGKLQRKKGEGEKVPDRKERRLSEAKQVEV